MVTPHQAPRFPAVKSVWPHRPATKRWVGLDIGSSSIKLIELEQTATGIRLVNSVIQELPSAQGPQSIDRVGWLQATLKEFGAKEVHLAVGGPEVAIRRVRVPPMSTEELAEAVKWQVKDELPFPIQEVVLDFEVLGEVWDKDIKKQDLLVAAASKPFLQQSIAAVERAGVRVASVTPAHVALWSCVAALIPEAREGSVALVEIGAKTTHVTIVKDGHVRVVRDLPLGSASLTNALTGVVTSEQGTVTIDRAQAEILKRRYGVLPEAPEGKTEDGVPLFHLASLMRPVMEQLLTEVSRFLDFYRAQMEEGGVSRVLLCGGGANLKQLQPFLADGLGMTVEVFNPLIRITDRAEPVAAEQLAEEGPRLAAAVGSALDHGQGMNLLPTEVRRARMPVISRRARGLAARALAGLALALYLGAQLTAVALGHRVRSQQAVWAQAEPRYREYLRVSSTRTALEGTMAQGERFLNQRPVWEGIFKELGVLIPSTIVLSELSVVPDEDLTSPVAVRIALKGKVVSGGATAQGSISRLVGEMEDSVFFRDVKLVSSEMRAGEAGTTRFELEGLLE